MAQPEHHGGNAAQDERRQRTAQGSDPDYPAVAPAAHLAVVELNPPAERQQADVQRDRLEPDRDRERLRAEGNCLYPHLPEPDLHHGMAELMHGDTQVHEQPGVPEPAGNVSSQRAYHI